MSRPYRFVLRALPDEYRRTHGDELVDTALELRNGRWSLRESAQLLTHGLRTRALTATGGSGRAAVGQAIMTTIELIAIGMVVLMTAWLFEIKVPLMTYATKQWMIPVIALTGAALLTRGRKPIIVMATVLTFAAQFGVRWPSSSSREFAAAITIQAVLIAVAGTWAVRQSAARTHPARSAVLLIGLGLVGILDSPIMLGNLLGISLLAGTVIGLLIAPWDPRLLLLAMCALVWNQLMMVPFFFGGPFADTPTWVWISRVVFAALVLALPTLALRRLRIAI